MIFGVFMRKKEGGGGEVQVSCSRFQVQGGPKEKRCAIIKFSDADDADDADKL